jgi:hypothetical protein
MTDLASAWRGSQASDLSSPSSDPLMDFRLRYLFVGESRPRSRANYNDILYFLMSFQSSNV